MKFILLLRSVRDRGASYFQRMLKRTHNLRGSRFYPVARRRNGRRMQKIFGFCFPSSERSKCSRVSRFGLGCGGVSDERRGTSSLLDFRFAAKGLPEWTAETMTVRFGAPLHILGKRIASIFSAACHLPSPPKRQFELFLLCGCGLCIGEEDFLPDAPQERDILFFEAWTMPFLRLRLVRTKLRHKLR